MSYYSRFSTSLPGVPGRFQVCKPDLRCFPADPWVIHYQKSPFHSSTSNVPVDVRNRLIEMFAD